tara:strand:+ start:336 stop:542 length:207 start_codon:yes stop_codon:yes gene_type:complete
LQRILKEIYPKIYVAMKSKKANKRERELRLKARMKENLLKRKKQSKLKKLPINNLEIFSVVDKGTSNG